MRNIQSPYAVCILSFFNFQSFNKTRNHITAPPIITCYVHISNTHMFCELIHKLFVITLAIQLKKTELRVKSHT